MNFSVYRNWKSDGSLSVLCLCAGNQQCTQSPFTDLNTKGLHLKNPQIKRLTQDLTGKC